ncbi:MAG: hypothetical protein AAFU54_19040 [Chloroflexota bacterium]
MYYAEEQTVRDEVNQAIEQLEQSDQEHPALEALRRAQHTLNSNTAFFVVTHVAREDIKSQMGLTEEQSATITDADMAYVASKLGDALMHSYWDALEIVVQHHLNFAEASEE